MITQYTYEPQTFRLKTLRTRRSSNPALQSLEYVYDLVGNIISVSDQAQTRMENGQPYIANPRIYSYDPLYRLISASGNERKKIKSFLPPNAPFVVTTDVNQFQTYERQYEYDEVGNIHFEKSLRTANQWTNTYSYREGTNILERTSRETPNQTETYRFDANGNMTRMMDNWHYYWDFADRMKGMENRPQGKPPTMETNYFYDSSGMRVKKVVRNGNRIKVTIYIDELFEEYIERLGANVKERKQFQHILAGTNRVALIKTILVATRSDNEPPVLYQHADHLGSSHVVTQLDGSFYNQEEYYPYGETSFGSYARKRFRFTGKERDEESSLYYYGARYYVPWLGRWMNCDPAGMAGGLNVYQYASGNPVKLIDRTGKAAAPSQIILMQSSRPVTSTFVERAAMRWGTAEVINGGVRLSEGTAGSEPFVQLMQLKWDSPRLRQWPVAWAPKPLPDGHH